ncbi:MAG: tRNA (cytidine(34)-2'-O)-methyltransferase [Arenicellales bacterium]
MFSVVLHQPQIPPNTGNIIRLCANTGCSLHLIKPLGFSLDEKHMRRAGLDYHQLTHVNTWKDWLTFTSNIRARLVSFSTRNVRPYTDFKFQPDDALLFGSETRGLPDELQDQLDPECKLFIPMQAENRSLNLSNCVAIAVYEAWRQQGFAGSKRSY